MIDILRLRHETPCTSYAPLSSSCSWSHCESASSESRWADKECNEATATTNARTEATIRPAWEVEPPSEIVKRNASPVSAMVGICQSRVSHCWRLLATMAYCSRP